MLIYGNIYVDTWQCLYWCAAVFVLICCNVYIDTWPFVYWYSAISILIPSNICIDIGQCLYWHFCEKAQNSEESEEDPLQGNWPPTPEDSVLHRRWAAHFAQSVVVRPPSSGYDAPGEVLTHNWFEVALEVFLFPTVGRGSLLERKSLMMKRLSWIIIMGWDTINLRLTNNRQRGCVNFVGLKTRTCWEATCVHVVVTGRVCMGDVGSLRVESHFLCHKASILMISGAWFVEEIWMLDSKIRVFRHIYIDIDICQYLYGYLAIFMLYKFQ